MPQFRPRQTKRAQQLRNNATETERRLWAHLRQRRLGGFKFSRQMSVGPFVCDFLCRERGVIVELDGGQHAERTPEDERRTAYLNQQGLTVLRFWNNEVFENLDGVLQLILTKVEELPAKFERPPLPLAGGDEPRKGSHESSTFVGSRSGEGVGPTCEISHNVPTPQPPPASGRGLS